MICDQRGLGVSLYFSEFRHLGCRWSAKLLGAGLGHLNHLELLEHLGRLEVASGQVGVSLLRRALPGDPSYPSYPSDPSDSERLRNPRLLARYQRLGCLGWQEVPLGGPGWFEGSTRFCKVFHIRFHDSSTKVLSALHQVLQGLRGGPGCEVRFHDGCGVVRVV